MSENEVMTLWVRLKGEERDRATRMKDKEKRSYASLIRVALDQYYENNHSDALV